MSEYDQNPPEVRDEESPEASVHTAQWSPWIWVVPVLAIFFVGWLVVRYGFFGGGDITVRFAEARGLERYSPVRYKGAKVGTVQKISIDQELDEVVVRISMDATMGHALNTGTKFWIVEPGLEGGGLGGLLSGTYVGISPGEGEKTREFRGQEYPPVLAPPEAGRTFILETNRAGSLTAGSPVLFEGMRVGRVLGAEYEDGRDVMGVHVFVVQRFADRVRQSTRFWRSGGLSISLGGGGLSMGDASLSSLLNAGVEFYTPEVLAGAPVRSGTRFELHDSRGAAIASSDGPHLTYLTYFPGSIGGLAPGTPVQMKGVRVGHVRDVRLRYVPENGTLETPVVIEIDPRELEVEVLPTMSPGELRVRMNDVLATLVRNGMRARLATSLVLPGASAVNLDMVAARGTGQLILTSNPPVIPAVSGGDGLQDALGAVGRITSTIENLPLQQIAGNMRSASQRLNTLVSDPALERSLERLERSLVQIEQAATTANQNVEPITRSLRSAAESAEAASRTIESVAGNVGENVEPIAESLRNAAAAAETAARRAEQLLGSSQRQNYDVAELVKELTRAAEAVRALASYLTENPDAVLKGRRE